MDIVLNTNAENPSLVLRDIERFSDGSGFGSRLVVRSGNFAAELPFYFEEHPLKEFLASLEEMDRTLTGKAKLKPMFEDSFFELELNGTGHVYVRGELSEYSEATQALKFGFKTDQTCLASFRKHLSQCLEARAT